MSHNIPAWERESTGHDGDEMVLNGVKYSFPLRSQRGKMYTDNAKVHNHHSAPTITCARDCHQLRIDYCDQHLF